MTQTKWPPPNPARFSYFERHITFCISVLIVVLIAVGCASPSGVTGPQKATKVQNSVRLFDPVSVIQDGWRHLPLRSTTQYQMAHVDGRLAVRAVGQNSASGLIRRVTAEVARCPIIEWWWRVDQLQAGADLRVKSREDVAASLFILFGDPGFLSDPEPVPTLRYVWTNERIEWNAVVDNPYLPGTVRSISVQSGTRHLGRWVQERRNLLEDFERAFGEPPQNEIEAVALFTDNDQTKQPVMAYYGPVQLICTRGTS